MQKKRFRRGILQYFLQNGLENALIFGGNIVQYILILKCRIACVFGKTQRKAPRRLKEREKCKRENVEFFLKKARSKNAKRAIDKTRK